jgi:hypothetical protein
MTLPTKRELIDQFMGGHPPPAPGPSREKYFQVMENNIHQCALRGECPDHWHWRGLQGDMPFDELNYP